MASCSWRPLRASWPAACASTQVRAPGKTSWGRQDAGQGDHGVRAWPGSRPRWWCGRPSGARSGRGRCTRPRLRGPAAPRRARCGGAPRSGPSCSRSAPGLIEPPGLLDHLHDPGRAQQRLGVGHGMDEQAARAGPDQAGAAGPHRPGRRRTGRTGRGRSRRRGPVRRAGWRLRGRQRWRRTRQRRGWRPHPCGACGGWRSGRSPPATAACRHRRPRGRPGRGRAGRRSRRPRTTSRPRPASKPPAVAAKKLANRPMAPLTARAWSRPTRLSASRRRSGSCSYSRTSSSGSMRAISCWERCGRGRPRRARSGPGAAGGEATSL